jgi:hypothetical protein
MTHGHHGGQSGSCLYGGCQSNCQCNSCSSCRGANLCGHHEPCCGEKPLRCDVKLTLPCDAMGVAFAPTMCGCPQDLKLLTGRVRRRGQAKWLLEYPAWDTDPEGNIQFRFDTQFKMLKPGRYEFQIQVKDSGTHGACGPTKRPCGSAEITLKQTCPINLTKHALVKRDTSVYPPRPVGVTSVFDAIQTFSANLCALMDRGDSVLRLGAADMQRLCAITLCKPVQLVISDGINSEVVTFSGCTSGTPTVVRGNPQYKFPRNATIKFEWTMANAVSAQTGCP